MVVVALAFGYRVSYMKMSGRCRRIIGAALGLLAFCGVAAGVESTDGESVVLFEDSFERSELGAPWHIVVPSFEIKEGRLVAHQCVMKIADVSSTECGVPMICRRLPSPASNI